MSPSQKTKQNLLNEQLFLKVYYMPSTLLLRQSSLQSLQCSCEDGERGGLAYEGIISMDVHCCSREGGGAVSLLWGEDSLHRTREMASTGLDSVPGVTGKGTEAWNSVAQ